jgi:Thymidylate kinase
MIILLEGPDGAGKTTLAQQLVVDLTETGKNVRLLRRGPIQNDVFTEYLRPLDELVGKSMDTIWILDRWHVGEHIYGPLLRGKSELTVRQSAYLEMVLQTFGCHFMHITCTTQTLLDRWDVRPDGLVKREWLSEVHDHYMEYVGGKTHWTTWFNGFTRPFAVKYPSPMPGVYIGPSRPNVLLLGDKRNLGTYTWPFVPAKSTSGHWLMGALLAADVDYMRVGLVNASELGAMDLELLWYQLGKPPVVPLGKHAQSAWRMTGKPQETYLHHPQYMRRFHYMKFDDYGRTIKEAMRDV